HKLHSKNTTSGKLRCGLVNDWWRACVCWSIGPSCAPATCFPYIKRVKLKIMRSPKRIKLLLLLVVLCLFACGSIAQKSKRGSRRPSPPAIICKISSVPNGMVIVGYKRNSACSDGTELLVKQPENGDIICAESPVPPQFSIATEAQGDSVGTCPKKAFLIQRASSGPATRVDDDAIGRAFASRTSEIQVEGEGTVIRLLPDDLNGPRHQRFIVQLAS